MHERGPRIDSVLRALRWALLALCVYAFLRTAWLCDDAFITFRVVDNLVHGYGLRWNVAERVQVFTHPLWMLSLTVPYFFTREIYYTSLFSCLALSAVAVWWVAFRIARTPGAGLMGLAILTSSKAFVDYSTSGLENPVTHLLLVLFAQRVLKPAADTRDVVIASTLAGLGILNRPDTALLFLPALLWSVRGRRGSKLILPLALSAIPVGLWLLFATFYYGFPLPNTAVAKLGSGIGLAEMAGHGVAYIWNSLSRDPVTLVTIAAVLVVTVRSKSTALLAWVVGPALYLAYAVWIGGDFMSGRFFTAPLLCAVIALVSPQLRVRDTWSLVFAGAAIVCGLLVPYPVLLSDSRYGLSRADLVDDRGIADERGYYYWMTGLLNGRDGPRPGNADVTRIRAWSRCNYPLAIEGTIGFLGYVGGPRLHLVDYHGLADPLLSRLPVVERDPLYEAFCEEMKGTPCRDGIRIGHFTRSIPPGYLSRILGQEGRFEDPKLARFVEKLSFVTRGPLLDPGRLKEVLLFNLGRYDEQLREAASRRVYEPPRWEEVITALGESAAGQAYLGGRLFESNGPAAEQAFRSALARCPEDADSAVNLAIVLYREERYEEAIAYCQGAIEVDPWMERAFNGLGHALGRQGRTDEALAAFDRALELDPTMIEAYRGRGMALLQAERWEQARDAFDLVSRLAPRDAEAQAKLAAVHAQLGDEERARKAWALAEALRTAAGSP